MRKGVAVVQLEGRYCRIAKDVETADVEELIARGLITVEDGNCRAAARQKKEQTFKARLCKKAGCHRHIYHPSGLCWAHRRE